MKSANLKVRGANWKNHDFARLHISVGQSYHEGDKLAAQIGWLAGNFRHVTICVNDTLQRHNYEGAQEAGREWIERNIHILRRLPSFDIKRWDEWRNHPDFKANLGEMHRLYREDNNFRYAVDAEALAFWNRRPEADKAEFLARSAEYLLEECAGFLIMFKNPAADLYPGSTLLPCKLFKSDAGAQGFTRLEPRAA